MNNLDDNKIRVEVEVDESNIVTCNMCHRELDYKYDSICEMCYLESIKQKRNSIWLVIIILFFIFYLFGTI